MGVYFTSDLHLGHNREFIYKNRGFTDIVSHDKAVIDGINEVVTEDDYLWILGDICFGDISKDDERKYFEDLIKINCGNVNVIIGNHDSPSKVEFYKELGWNVVGYAYLLNVKKHPYMLSHYPTLTRNGTYKGELHREVINLYGHTHQETPFLIENEEEIPLSFHVGVDSNNLRPIEIGEIRKMVHEKYREVLNELEPEEER